MAVLRRFFPLHSPCPSCGTPDAWVFLSTSRQGGMQYRRCKCGRNFRVMMIAQEVDQGTGQSRIEVFKVG